MEGGIPKPTNGFHLTFGNTIAAIGLLLQTLIIGGTIIWQVGTLKTEIAVLNVEVKASRKDYDDLQAVVDKIQDRLFYTK